MIINLIAITAFYGTWTGLDHIFAPTDTIPYGLALNGAYCCILGVSCGVVVFLLQFIFLWLYYRNRCVEKPENLSPFWKWLRLLGFNAMLLLSLIGNVASFRGFWNVLDAFFIPNNYYLSTTICQLLGLFYMFVFYSGTSLHGGVKRDNENVMIPNFFLTYLLCNKL